MRPIMTRARYGLESRGGNGCARCGDPYCRTAPSDPIRCDANPRLAEWSPRIIAGANARMIIAVTSRVVGDIRAGAYSARMGNDHGLTYADGWTAAATLAQLVSADAIAQALAENADV